MVTINNSVSITNNNGTINNMFVNAQNANNGGCSSRMNANNYYLENVTYIELDVGYDDIINDKHFKLLKITETKSIVLTSLPTV